MKKLFAIFLALLMLTTNVGVTFATHYCGGKAVKTEVALGQEYLSCGMVKADVSCENNPHIPVIKKKGCCENKYAQLKIQEDYSISVVVKAAADFHFITAFAVPYIHFYSYAPSTEFEYLNYSPPLLQKDIPVLIQSFLI